MNLGHEYEDLSYHGSPSYHCRFCGCWDRSKDAKEPCPKAAEKLAEERAQKEREERNEYERHRIQQARIKYLEEKYGSTHAPQDAQR